MLFILFSLKPGNSNNINDIVEFQIMEYDWERWVEKYKDGAALRHLSNIISIVKERDVYE